MTSEPNAIDIIEGGGAKVSFKWGKGTPQSSELGTFYIDDENTYIRPFIGTGEESSPKRLTGIYSSGTNGISEYSRTNGAFNSLSVGKYCTIAGFIKPNNATGELGTRYVELTGEPQVGSQNSIIFTIDSKEAITLKDDEYIVIDYRYYTIEPACYTYDVVTTTSLPLVLTLNNVAAEDKDYCVINYAYIVGSHYTEVNSDVRSGAIALGFDSTAAGQGAFAGGYRNLSLYAGATTFGYNNKTLGDSGFTAGNHNINRGTVATVFGSNNTANAYGTFIAGSQNKSYGGTIGNTILGVNNTLLKGSTDANGKEIKGQGNFITGINNTLNGDIFKAFIAGSDNILSGSANSSVLIGTGLVSSKNNQFVLGTYNVEDSNNLFVLGAGNNASERKNVVTINKSGNINTLGSVNATSITTSAGINAGWIKTNSVNITQLNNNQSDDQIIKGGEGVKLQMYKFYTTAGVNDIKSDKSGYILASRNYVINHVYDTLADYATTDSLTNVVKFDENNSITGPTNNSNDGYAVSLGYENIAIPFEKEMGIDDYSITSEPFYYFDENEQLIFSDDNKNLPTPCYFGYRFGSVNGDTYYKYINLSITEFPIQTGIYKSDILDDESNVTGKMIHVNYLIPKIEGSNYAPISLGYAGVAAGMGASNFGYRNVSIGNGTLTGGYHNKTISDTGTTVGANNVNYGNATFVGGVGNTVKTGNTIVYGSNNSVEKNNSDSAIFGHNNTAEENTNVNTSNLCAGKGNTLKSTTRATALFGTSNIVDTTNSLVAGYENTVGGNQNIVGGYRNNVKSTISIVSGSSNNSQSTASATFGNNNTNTGNYAFVAGNGNNSSGEASITLGLTNTNKGKGSFVVGEGNVNNNGGRIIVAGRSNTIDGIVHGSAVFGCGNIVKDGGSFANAESAILCAGKSNTVEKSVGFSGVIGNNNTLGDTNNVANIQGNAVFGGYNKLVANYSFISGSYNTIDNNNINNSFVAGTHCCAARSVQRIFGQYNVANTSSDAVRFVDIVGWGTSDTDRKNIYTLDTYGNATFTGTVTANGSTLATEEYVSSEIQKIPAPDLTAYATKEYTDNTVKTEITKLVDSAPEALDTLGELAEALNNHEDAYDALLETIGNKVDRSELVDYATIKTGTTAPDDNDEAPIGTVYLWYE